MRQLVQNFKTGELLLEEVPPPVLKPGGVLVRNAYSLISAGTERTTVSTAQASIVGKAKQRPDLVKQVIDNVKREGLIATYKKVKTRLETLKPLGYSSAGVVLESSCEEFQPGDRVACAGAGYASHAEILFVPKNLCIKVPDNVGLDEGSFATLGAIALQGVRQSEVHIGENVVVIGLGLLGLLTVAILKAGGCRVIGADISEDKFEYAKGMGCDEVCLPSELPKIVPNLTKGYGADAVILTASTRSNEPIELAGEISRKKAKVVIVGVVGLDVPRGPHYYQKELDIRFSCSYGPGRYDPDYEEKGHDYPFGYVRWTERRNMDAFLELVSQGKINLRPPITHVFAIEDAISAYELILGKRKEQYIGVLLKYPQERKEERRVLVTPSVKKHKGEIKVGFIGAGNFAQSYLIPNLKRIKDVSLKVVATASGVNAKSVAEKFGFEKFTTDASALLEDEEIDVIFIATRHNLHALYVIKALETGKHVYVEKPLCIYEEELGEIIKTYKRKIEESEPRLLMVGFNRRFSPMAEAVKSHFLNRSFPLAINMRINAGYIPPDHWTQDPEIGGGRIVGEVCHFVDLARYWIDKPVVSVFTQALPSTTDKPYLPHTVSVVLKYSDGSITNLLYLANGDSSISKEYHEVFGGGRTAILDDFRKIIIAGEGKRKIKKAAQDKGHKNEMVEVVRTIKEGKDFPISFESLIETTKVTFAIMESIRNGNVVNLASEEV